MLDIQSIVDTQLRSSEARPVAGIAIDPITAYQNGCSDPRTARKGSNAPGS